MLDNQVSFLAIGSTTQDVYLSNVDGIVPVCRNPEDCFYDIKLGQKIYVNSVDYEVGGGASNAAVTFARGGQPVTFMGKIGMDMSAQAALRCYADEGVDYSALTISEEYNTDYSTILLAPNGERTIFTYRGCGMFFSPDDFDFNKLNRKIDWIYLTSMVNHFEIYDKITDFAVQNHCKIAFNPGAIELDHPDKLKQVLRNVQILSVNKEEAQRIVPGDTLEELLKNLREYCPVVIITDGANGSIATDRHQTLRAGLYKDTTESVDRTGAGDAFCSGFTLRYALGDSLREAIHFAAANASSVVQHVGAKPGILRGRPQLDPMDIHEIAL